MKTSRVVAVVLLLGLLAAGYLYYQHTPDPLLPQASVAGPAGSGATGAARPPGGRPDEAKSDDTGATPEPPSQLVASLNSPSGDVHADLRMIDQVFIAFRAGTHAENPVGENAEITAALTGKNSADFAFIPKDCPAINAKGELCDRWGSPYFFHQLSGTEMEIRSAGPDKKLWTADDEVMTPY